MVLNEYHVFIIKKRTPSIHYIGAIMKVTTLVTLLNEKNHTQEELNTLFTSKALPLIEQTIQYLSNNEGCGTDTYRNALETGTTEECCEHLTDFYTDMYIELVVINQLEAIKNNTHALTINDCNFFSYEFDIAKDQFTEDELEFIDFSGVTLSLNGRTYSLDYQDSTKGFTNENTIQIEVDCANIQEAKDTFEDCKFDLTLADLASNFLSVTAEVFCDQSLVKKTPRYLKGLVGMKINGRYFDIPIVEDKDISPIEHAITDASYAIEQHLLVRTNQQCNDDHSCFDCIASQYTDGEYDEKYDQIIEALEKAFPDYE